MDPPRPSSSRCDRAQILKVAASLGMLAGGPHSAPRIMAALCDPDVVASDVAKLISRDPGLFARVLRVANSPFYGHSRSIMTLERAIIVLGLDAVRGIAAAACLDRTVPRGKPSTLLDLSTVVSHSIATAAAAEALAKAHRPECPSEAFIAGLLHNLGIVVQIHLDPSGVRAMIASRAAADQREIRALEAAQAAVGHEECMSVIFDAWQLPQSLSAATRDHHDPMAAYPPHRELTSLVNLGAYLALGSGNTFTLEPWPGRPNTRALELLGLDHGHLEAIATDLPARVATLKKALLDG